MCNPVQFNPFISSGAASSSSSYSSSMSLSSSSTSSSSVSSSDYRILRTLYLDVHEARNISTSPTNDSISNSKSPNVYYYCTLMFNRKAFVASTRIAASVSSSSLSSSSSSGSSLEYGSVTGSGGSSMIMPCRDAIWDDSFTFDSLPLDVNELSLCLFCIVAKGPTSASIVVNNLRRLSSASQANTGQSKMLDPFPIGTGKLLNLIFSPKEHFNLK